MLALEGVRILDMSRLVPGPMCSMHLADFGAEVIKIEAPGKGDYARDFGPFYNGFGYWHLQLNRNKKSVVLDLKKPEDRENFLKLVETADVVMESYRPGVLKKLGVDYETAKKRNPKIIYCSLNGYGDKGPLCKQADHDLNFLSTTGVTSMSGALNGQPALPGVQMADVYSALYAGMSILIALRHAQATGQGQEILISLYNVCMTLLPGAASLYFGAGFVPERGNNWLTGTNPNYHIYETADKRYMAVGCLEKKFWGKLCEALGRPELTDKIDDQKEYPYLIEQVGVEFKKRTMREWEAYLAGKDTCASPVLNFAEACESEQTKANEMVMTVHDEEIGDYRLLGFPMKLSETPASVRKHAPRLGEDTEAILAELLKKK